LGFHIFPKRDIVDIVGISHFCPKRDIVDTSGHKWT
jgi:hypothetical protein